ncbi:flavin-dependent oxidoreductase [Sulfitobacter sp. M220]|jgi:2-polyprenyl-6-methoxyphenol hydroxylase-like FAD-dependent oxidoreductase|nr:MULTISPECIES: flavin-dependent oxidoreductase [unclassified Sulfitobacter]MCF7728292.1 flavin-dependent oxidoreductase [Sulfitobacter sp. M22]MCF7779281.1 flavin-dependent oxidoreductase [Sulfitobacter sp. M220]
MTQPHILIAGGGIGGLALALSLHQLGVRCTVYEQVRALKPLGVGINIQPNAVRELFDLGLTPAQLDKIGVPAREWALVGQKGQEIYAEPRGTDAGYRWPQYAAHRGQLHMLLYQTLVDRAGPEAVQLGAKISGYSILPEGGVTATINHTDGSHSIVEGTLLIGADGIHSAVRAQMHPHQPPIHWGGALMWRGTSRAKPVRTGSSFVGLGDHRQRMVIYPISAPDADGFATINWIAEVTLDETEARKSGWYKPAQLSDFAHHFDGWTYDWLDVPALLRGASEIYENPMIDRDPVSTWVDGPVALIGDAAHAMYPTGSNGASQAIMDARNLCALMVKQGVTPAALRSFDNTYCGPISDLILRNRGAGPFGLLNMVNDRCDGTFDRIDDVIPAAERSAYMAQYKTAAGFAVDALNAADPTLPQGARLVV